jgi:hypothetical protein
MSDRTNNLQTDNLTVNKRSLAQNYLQNPFSITWSKLATLFSPEVSTKETTEEILPDDSFKPQESNSIGDRDLYPRFTDRVDPSLYYTVFFPHQR